VDYVLGISAFYHDSAAALLGDGRILAAAQEERFTRVKHDHRFPVHAVGWCLEEAGIDPSDLSAVAFYDKPLLKFERLLETWLAVAPAGFRAFSKGLPLWLKEKLHLPRLMDRGLGGRYKKRYVFPEHHESHAASAFFPSPFERAAILTMDGVGEWATSSFGVGEGKEIRLLGELRFPASLGLLYSAFTYYCGFRVNSGEYKLMGLAPYGEPRFKDLILERLLDLKEDGSFSMDMSFFHYHKGLTMTSGRFHRLFGRPPRPPEGPLEPFHMDVAASIQKVTEEVVLKMARHVARETGERNLCLAGGVALNCVANGRLLREGPFENLWIQPAAGDAGGALGAALFTWHQLMEGRRTPRPEDSQEGSLLGPSFSTEEIEAFLRGKGAVWTRFDREERLLDRVTEALLEEKVVGWFQGRMEFGPRALGCRSILGDPRSRKMQSVMNLKIKFRESFRPFAPSVLREEAHEWFQVEEGTESPYMLLVAPVHPGVRLPVKDELQAKKGLEKLGIPRSKIPAVTHVDFSARLQTVDERRHGRYYRLIRRFFQKTGCPLLVNTSFNVRGEPIVLSPEDAWNCFMATNMDILVLEDLVLEKKAQPGARTFPVDEHLARFRPD